MFDEILLPFQKNKRAEPRWYMIGRAIVGVAGLIAIVVYFAYLLMELLRREKYMVTTRVGIFDNPENYNGKYSIPDFSQIFLGPQNTLPELEANCTLETFDEKRVNFPGCDGIFNISKSGNLINYVNSESNPQFFSDLAFCSWKDNHLLPSCQFWTSITISFSLPDKSPFPPASYVYFGLHNENPITVDEFNRDIGSVRLTQWIAKPDEVLVITLTFTENHYVNGDIAYENTQQATIAPAPSNSTSARVLIMSSNFYITKNYERYTRSYGDLLALVGGFYGIFASFFTFFFGASLIAPWGFLPKHILGDYLSKKIKEVHFKEPYPTSIPLHEATDPEILRRRLNRLEKLLGEFYLDEGLLEKLIPRAENSNVDTKAKNEDTSVSNEDDSANNEDTSVSNQDTLASNGYTIANTGEEMA